MLVYVLLIIGFVFLIKGADLLVDGSSAIAKKLGISNLVIGLTVVAFGTSAPELLLNIIASWQGSGDLVLGNIIGSNISNILLIGGVAAVIYPLRIRKSTTWKGIPLSLLAMVVLFFLANDSLIDNNAPSMISRIDGLVLIVFFLIFLYYTFGVAKIKDKNREGEPYKNRDWQTSLVYIILGMIGLAVGGKWIIDSATTIAGRWGISEALIGLTVLAIGTSLPELATAATAAYKKKADLAIGNIIGSNIFNVFFVLGVSGVVRPIFYNNTLNTDIIVGIMATLLLYYFVLVGKKRHHLVRWEGVGLLVAYGAYVSFLVVRG